jgi:perosamine synthetase
MTQQFIPVARPDLSGNEKRYVNEALNEGWISSSGRFIERFERDFAAFCGTKHAVSCCNGTVAIHVLLVAMGIGPGDEVIVPTFTYVASANAVTYTGAKAILVDCEAIHWNLDPTKVEEAITHRTKAIMAVHIYGHPADMDAILDVGRRHGIPVIEDAAEAHGAEVKGKRVGSMGLGSTFSFFGNKIVSTGEGGMVTTDDDDLAAKMRQLKCQGMDPKRRYWFPMVGYNYRMTNIEAALGCAQLERVDDLIKGRLRIAENYRKRLDSKAESAGITLPTQATWAKHVYWLYSIRVPVPKRDVIMERLAALGIETRPFFPPMHTLPIYCGPGHGKGPFSVAEQVATSGISLPTFQSLSEAEQDRICEHILTLLKTDLAT